jgi:nicotinate phosphoribosyltransferase
VYRLYGRESGKAEADLLCLYDEEVDDSQPYELFDPEHTWKRKLLTDYVAKPLHVQVFKSGELVYDLPALGEIRAHCFREIESMWDEVRRFSNPHNYYVDLSQKLWDIKHEMLQLKRGNS